MQEPDLFLLIILNDKKKLDLVSSQDEEASIYIKILVFGCKDKNSQIWVVS